MKAQDVFETVWNHFVGGGEQLSKDEHGNSEYVSGVWGGTFCPVGLLIPTNIYEIEMEGFGVILLHKNYPSIQNLFKDIDIFFLSKLQEAHDTSETKEEFKNELIKIAKSYGLKVPKVTLTA